jgi:hypothetical protein
MSTNAITRLTAAFLWCLAVLPGGAFAQTGQRLTDKEVKALIETVDKGRDRFEDQLDGKLKDNILRGPNGEVNVARFLDDLQENTHRLKERFTTEYAASAEVATVLRQATPVDAFMKQKPGIKGSSEWDHLASSLGRLAAAYGTTFPLEANAPVRRVSDGEAAKAAGAIEDQADEFKDAVNREELLAKPVKDGLKGEAEVVKNAAKTLKSRVSDSKPATSEARQLVAAIRKMRESAKGLTPASLEVLGQMQAPLGTLSQAFGLTPSDGGK